MAKSLKRYKFSVRTIVIDGDDILLFVLKRIKKTNCASLRVTLPLVSQWLASFWWSPSWLPSCSCAPDGDRSASRLPPEAPSTPARTPTRPTVTRVERETNHSNVVCFFFRFSHISLISSIRSNNSPVEFVPLKERSIVLFLSCNGTLTRSIGLCVRVFWKKRKMKLSGHLNRKFAPKDALK